MSARKAIGRTSASTVDRLGTKRRSVQIHQNGDPRLDHLENDRIVDLLFEGDTIVARLLVGGMIVVRHMEDRIAVHQVRDRTVAQLA